MNRFIDTIPAGMLQLGSCSPRFSILQPYGHERRSEYCLLLIGKGERYSLVDCDFAFQSGIGRNQQKSF
jgi:hypothetical protein